jgi:hypothetical protein
MARPGLASKVPLVELEGGVAHQPVVAQQQRLARRPIAKVHQVCSHHRLILFLFIKKWINDNLLVKLIPNLLNIILLQNKYARGGRTDRRG